MNLEDITEDNHKERSRFIKKLIQNPSNTCNTSSVYAAKPPMRIVQFWDRLDRLPQDVRECIETWTKLEEQGFERLLFDTQKAKEYIYNNLGSRYLSAFGRCYHPAMQADYFRLCYIFVEGGCYIDADDVYNGAQIRHLFNDGRLKIQPLCYDAATNVMVPPALFTKAGIDAESWIFYFNNNPLIACREHPVIKRALTQATSLLEREITNGLPEIQSTTGPGNLSKSIFDVITENGEMEHSLLVLCNWEEFAISKWELDYRNDTRNWRNSNCISKQE